MPSPLIEANSTSLGAWTSTINGVNVAAGEVVSLRLADTAGVVFWDFALESTDDLTDAHGTRPVPAINFVSKTASFTVPVDPANGVALRFRSTVGVMNFGLDGNGAAQPSYTSFFGVFVLAPSGIRVLPVSGTVETSSRYGWTQEVDAVIRTPPGSGSAPTGAAGGDLGGSYPNPSVLRIRGASVPASGTLVTGNVLQVTGVSTLSYGPVNLAGGVNFVTGSLPLTNMTIGAANTALVTNGAGTAAVWALIVDANVSNVAPAKLTQSAATSGQALLWNGSIWAPGTISVGTISGTLPVNQIAPGTNGQIISTVAGAAAWVTIAGDVTGAPSATVVGRINGATVPTAGALTTGHVLRVTGIAALTYGFITDANVDPAAAIAVTKIAPGTNGQFLGTVAGAATWTTVTLGGLGGVPTSRTLTGLAPIQIDTVNTPVDLSANRTISVLTATTGALGVIQLAGDLGGTGTVPLTLRLRGTTIGTAGGALVVGTVLRVTGAATADWQALTLADTTGTLPIARLANGTDGQVLTTVGTTPTWAQIVNANIAAAAAIAVTKLANGTDGQILTTVGATPTWTTGAPASSLPQSANQSYNVATRAALNTVPPATAIGGELCVVRSIPGLMFQYQLGDAGTPNGIDIIAGLGALGNWYQLT